MISHQLVLDRHYGREPFSSCGKAPPEYLEAHTRKRTMTRDELVAEWNAWNEKTEGWKPSKVPGREVNRKVRIMVPTKDNIFGAPNPATWGKEGVLVFLGMGPFAAEDYWADVILNESVDVEVKTRHCHFCGSTVVGSGKIGRLTMLCSDRVEPIDGKPKDW